MAEEFAKYLTSFNAMVEYLEAIQSDESKFIAQEDMSLFLFMEKGGKEDELVDREKDPSLLSV